MQDIKLLGIPFDFGQDNIGVRLALDYLKDAGLIKRLRTISQLHNLGDLEFPFKSKIGDHKEIKWCSSVASCNKEISTYIENLDLDQSFLLNIGGDHGMALGTIHGVLSHHPDSVIVWADAHGDINTPESSSTGNFHGMPLSFLLKITRHPEFEWIKRHLAPHKLIFIGPRDLDQGELEIINELKIQYFTSDELNLKGAKEILDVALHRADPFGMAPIHLSFDVDLFDVDDIHSTGTKVANGPKIEEIFLMGGLLGETGRLKSMDLVEFNPLIGDESLVQHSAELILDFIETTLSQVFTFSSSPQRLPKELLQRAFNSNLFERENL